MTDLSIGFQEEVRDFETVHANEVDAAVSQLESYRADVRQAPINDACDLAVFPKHIGPNVDS